MSSDRAIQLHSLILNDEIDTWDDWKIVSIKRPVFYDPELRSEYAEVPGRDGSLDMTEALTGYPLYENRTGTMQFLLYDDSVPALTKLNVIRNYLHGRKHKIILSDEPEYYYIGRLMLRESHPTKEGEYAVFDLEYNLEPYKYEINSSVEDWLWDPFNFETGVIRNYHDMTLSFIVADLNDLPTIVKSIVGSRKPVVPTIVVTNKTVLYGSLGSSELTVAVNGTTYTLDNGTGNYPMTFVFPQLVLADDEYDFEFGITGGDIYSVITFTVDIKFRGGIL